MKIFLVQYFVVALMSALAAASSIQLDSTQGILIPAPIAQRLARAAYGGSSFAAGPSAAAFAAPAAAPAYAVPSANFQSSSSSAANSNQQVSLVPSPACPRNYLFSCAPSLAPVPCAQSFAQQNQAQVLTQPQPQLSSPHGAYSEFIPQYLMPNHY